MGLTVIALQPLGKLKVKQKLSLEAGQFVTKEIPWLSADFLAKYPDSIAFYEWTEQISFVNACRAAAAQGVWDLDPEFLDPPPYLPKAIPLPTPRKPPDQPLKPL